MVTTCTGGWLRLNLKVSTQGITLDVVYECVWLITTQTKSQDQTIEKEIQIIFESIIIAGHSQILVSAT